MSRLDYLTTRVCETCNAQFQFVAWPSEIKLGRGRFCSKNCQKQWQSVPVTERFQKYVGPTTERGCIIWIGATNRDGYGVIGSGGQQGSNILAHRLAYQMKYGDIANGLVVLHTCDNPPCINPSHLILGTQAENMTDMVNKGRVRKREPGSRRYMQDLRRR